MAAAVKWGIQVTGIKGLSATLKTLEDPQAPFLRAALEKGGSAFRGAAAARTRAGIAAATSFVGVKGTGAGLRAVVQAKHPGARSMEFGRKYYYRGYTGRRQKATGQRFKSPRGQAAKPYFGIVRGDAAVGAVKDMIAADLQHAVEAEWSRAQPGAGA